MLLTVVDVQNPGATSSSSANPTKLAASHRSVNLSEAMPSQLVQGSTAKGNLGKHTFLLEPGQWIFQGNWLERHGMPIRVKGKTIVTWGRDNWFTMVTMLVFPGSDRQSISLQYRGHLDDEERQYNFVLQHSQLGRIEGEGWLAPETIVQRYWVLNDRQRHTGFETLHRLNDDTYHLSHSVLSGHYLSSTIEATLKR